MPQRSGLRDGPNGSTSHAVRRSDEALLEAMVEHPILVNRPIVVTPKGVKLSRPSEAVLDLLERKPESFTKEDGEVVRP